MKKYCNDRNHVGTGTGSTEEPKIQSVEEYYLTAGGYSEDSETVTISIKCDTCVSLENWEN